jgi:hypothetical protein
MLSVALAAFQGWRLFRPNEKVKNLLLAEIRPVLGDNCNISKVRLSLSTIHFLGVDLPLEEQDYSIHIQDLRIRYNLIQLLTSGFDPQSISQDIILEHPRVDFYLHRRDSAHIDASPRSTLAINDLDDVKYEEQLKKLRFLKRLSVSGGEIVLHDSPGNATRLAHSIDGWLMSVHADTLEFRLEGNLFSSEKTNLMIRGQTELKDGTIEYASLKLKEYPLDEPIPWFDQAAFRLSGGVLNGSLSLQPNRKIPPLHRMSLNGHLSIDDGQGEWKNAPLSFGNIDARFRVRDWNLDLDRASLNVNDTPVTLKGSIVNILEPKLSLDVSSATLQFENFVGLLPPPSRAVSGLAYARIQIRGPVNAPRFVGFLRSPGATFFGIKTRELRTTFSYRTQTESLQLHDFEAIGYKLTLTGRGSLNWKQATPQINGDVHVSGDLSSLLASLGTDSLSHASTQARAHIEGALSQPHGTGFAEIAMQNESDSMRIRTSFELKEGVATLNHESHNGNPRLHGKLYLSDVPYFDVELTQVQKLGTFLWTLPREDMIRDQSRVHLTATGRLNDITFVTDIRKRQGSFYETPLIHLTTRLRNRRHDMLGEGRFTLYPDTHNEMTGAFGVRRTETGFFLDKLTLEDQLFMTLNQDPGGVNGLLRVDQLELSRVMGLADSVCIGFLNSDIKVSGHLENPELVGMGSVSGKTCTQGEPYTIDWDFSYQDDRFKLAQFMINSDETTLIDAVGHYDTRDDSIKVSIKGAGFDISTIARAHSLGMHHLAGRTLVDIDVSGTVQHPQVRGLLAIKEGRISKVPFDELELRFGGIKTSRSYPAQGLYVDRIRWSRRDVFSVTGNGFVPFNLDDSLHISLNGRGNFLSIFTDYQGYFVDSESDGIFSAELNGTLERPRLRKAHLTFDEGMMVFGSVIPRVTELKGDITFDPTSRFVHIQQFEGKMGGEWFRISNTRAHPSLAARPVENMDLGQQGINLGVFILETRERGVPVNIPGLMEDNIYGRLHLLGREPDELFYLAGPVDRPVLRGTLNLHNFEFRYPFQNVEAGDDNVVVEFLRNIDWDLDVRPIKDVRYVNTLPGALDQVYVNLQIEENWGRLEFSKQIEDETFEIEGQARSTAGFLEYLDMNFRVQEAGVEFDHGSIFPVVYGEARTTVTDSLGIPSQVILTLQTVDRTMDQNSVDDIVKQEDQRARWDQIRFKLTTDNPNLGSTEAQILASLGYSTATLQDKAFDAIGISTENILFRPLYRPVERQLETLLGLDYVRFSSRFTRNLISFNLNDNPELNSRLSLLRSTKVIVGKYLANRIFLQYTGQVEAGIDYRYSEKNIGLRHTFGLEYRISPKLLLELEYDYNSMMYENHDDKRIVLRHWFPF